jgi:DMSO/TMAO reductase YedYZ molybdopterin-dependent catalytic subunit
MQTLNALVLTLTFALVLSSAVAVWGQADSAIASINWSVTVDGAVSHPTTFSMADLAAFPYKQAYGAIYCEGTYVTSGTWGGFSLQALLDEVGINPSATTLEFYAADGYSINVAVAAVRSMIIAYDLDGQPLNETLRLVPGAYPGGDWISQITRIKVSYATFFNINPPFTPPATPTPAPTLPVHTPVPAVTATPLPPTPSPTSVPTETTTPTQTPMPTNQTVGNLQTQPPNSSGSPIQPEIMYLAVTAVVAVCVVAGLLLFKRRQNH